MSKRELDEQELGNVQGGADTLAPKDPSTGEIIQPPRDDDPEPPDMGGPGPVGETAEGSDTIGDSGAGNLDRN